MVKLMVEAIDEVTLPISAKQAFESLSDIEHATWLPGVRNIKKIGTKKGVGAKYAVQVSVVGRPFDGVLECTSCAPPKELVLALRESVDLVITAQVRAIRGGSVVKLTAAYRLTGPFAGALERSTIGAARREVSRAVESFAAQFSRKDLD